LSSKLHVCIGVEIGWGNLLTGVIYIIIIVSNTHLCAQRSTSFNTRLKEFSLSYYNQIDNIAITLITL